MSVWPGGVIPRSQLGDLVDGVAGCNAGQNVLEIGEGLDSAHLRGLDEGGHDGPMPCAAVAAGEEGILHGQLLGTDGSLDGALVHFDAAVGEEQPQAGRPAEHIANGLGAHSGDRGHPNRCDGGQLFRLIAGSYGGRQFGSCRLSLAVAL